MIVFREKAYSGRDNREDVPEDLLKESWETGVVQKDSNGDWRIINRQKGKFWNAHYKTRDDAEKALSAYHASK